MIKNSDPRFPRQGLRKLEPIGQFITSKNNMQCYFMNEFYSTPNQVVHDLAVAKSKPVRTHC